MSCSQLLRQACVNVLMLLACAVPFTPTRGAAASDTAASAQGASSAGQLEEIIVTAQKRSERLQDVPVPVTVLNVDTLAEGNQNRLQDYFATVPGLSLNQGGQGGGSQQSLAIRGVSTGSYTNPTVGVTIDDTPYGSSTALGFGSLAFPDIDPSDLERIEVLRGPQGTLYGASSIGGLVKFVTKDPSTDALSGHVQVLEDSVQHGDFGYGVRAMVNVPLSDSIAMRVSGFTRQDPGYVDNVITGQHDVNQVDVYGGHLAVLWRPSDTVSLKISALLQNIDGYGNSAVDTNGSFQPVYGDLHQARMPGTEQYDSRVRLYTATLTAKWAGLDFISISGYGDNQYSINSDNSAGYGYLAEQYFGVSGSATPNFYDTKKFSQEFRLSSASGGTLEWLAGAFYTHESSASNVAFLANNPATGASVGEVIDFDDPTTLSEYALFGDLTVHVTNRLDVQLGGRESKDRQVYNETDSGIAVPDFYFSPSPFVNQTERTNGNAFTYLVTPRFRISPDLMIYTRFTSGYRVGGDNVNAVVGHVPSSFLPDTTNNYEFGVKGDLFDRALTFDASAYYIDWKRIQIQLLNPATFSLYTANGGSAKSQGLELSVQARPTRGLTIAAVASVNDAELTQNLPPSSTAYGLAGYRLPYSSRFSGSFSVDQNIARMGQWTGFIGGSLAYVGAREGSFSTTSTQVRLLYPAYSTINLHIGARSDLWTVNLLVNNAANKRGIVGGGQVSGIDGPGEPGASATAFYIQPRTVGLTVSRDF